MAKKVMEVKDGPETSLDTHKMQTDSVVSLSLDIEKYRPSISAYGFTEEQERDYLETVWSMLVHCMKLGIQIEFDAKTCGQGDGAALSPPKSSENAVNCIDQHIDARFNRLAGPTVPVEKSTRS